MGGLRRPRFALTLAPLSNPSHPLAPERGFPKLTFLHVTFQDSVDLGRICSPSSSQRTLPPLQIIVVVITIEHSVLPRPRSKVFHHYRNT